MLYGGISDQISSYSFLRYFFNLIDLTVSISESSFVMDEEPSPFLFLPPELRNHVYRHALVADGSLVSYLRHRSEIWFGDRRPVGFEANAAILRTCRLVNIEACAVLYGENSWLFEDGLMDLFGCTIRSMWISPQSRGNGGETPSEVVYPSHILNMRRLFF